MFFLSVLSRHDYLLEAVVAKNPASFRTWRDSELSACSCLMKKSTSAASLCLEINTLPYCRLEVTVHVLVSRCHSVDVFEDDCVPNVMMINVKNVLVLYS